MLVLQAELFDIVAVAPLGKAIQTDVAVEYADVVGVLDEIVVPHALPFPKQETRRATE